MKSSVTADTTANTTACTGSDGVKKLTTRAAAAPTANQTETRAVVAASSTTKAITAISQNNVSADIRRNLLPYRMLCQHSNMTGWYCQDFYM